MVTLFLTFLTTPFNTLLEASGFKRPNILFIVADDLGWNDVGWNNPDILTPNLDILAKGGVILNQSYVQPLCTPTRAAFLTGKYPFRYGLQHYVINNMEPVGLPLHLKTLGEELQKLHYKTHLIGKWHLGYCSLNYTPTHRGFHTFFGFYGGMLDYYTHASDAYDLRNNEQVEWQYNGTYSTLLFGQKAVQLLETEKENFFLFLSLQAGHFLLQVPQNYTDLYPKITNPARRTYSAMITAMDEIIGWVVDALRSHGLYENTLIVFTTDNGGENGYGGNNFPLRGNKETIWEGGTRGIAFVHAPFLKKTGYTSNKLIHAVDWFPTFIHLAGGMCDADIDGVNQWKMLNEDGPSMRNEIVYNIDNTTDYIAAIRVGDYKLILGNTGGFNGWAKPDEVIDWKGEHWTYSELATSNKLQLTNLYNLKDDPSERYNIASQYPGIVKRLKKRIEKYNKQVKTSIHLPMDPRGDPNKMNGTISPGFC